MFRSSDGRASNSGVSQVLGSCVFCIGVIGVLNGHLTRKNTFAFLFSAHNIKSLSDHEQVYLNMLVHDVIKL